MSFLLKNNFSTEQHLFSTRKKRITFVVLLFLLLAGCNETSEKTIDAASAQKVIEIGNIEVPVYASAEEQLNYTRSWFADIQEKKASLQAFIQLYCDNKKLCGVAELDLAYLELGRDYRFAAEHAGFAAIKSYRAIVEKYVEYPEFMAKAYWYLGWIYANLLNDIDKGIQQFLNVADKYPEAHVSLLPPAPWVSITYREDDKVTAALYRRPTDHWAALALLEIIKHARDDALIWDSFERLWQGYRENRATGFALKNILRRRLHTEDALIRAKEYMEKNFSNVHILGDIQKEIKAITDSQSGVAG